MADQQQQGSYSSSEPSDALSQQIKRISELQTLYREQLGLNKRKRGGDHHSQLGTAPSAATASNAPSTRSTSRKSAGGSSKKRKASSDDGAGAQNQGAGPGGSSSSVSVSPDAAASGASSSKHGHHIPSSLSSSSSSGAGGVAEGPGTTGGAATRELGGKLEELVEELGGAAEGQTVFEMARERFGELVARSTEELGMQQACQAVVEVAMRVSAFRRGTKACQSELWVLEATAAGFDSEVDCSDDMPGVGIPWRYDSLEGFVLFTVVGQLDDVAYCGDVVDFVCDNWARPGGETDRKGLDARRIKSDVEATLRTSPLFEESPSNPGWWRATRQGHMLCEIVSERLGARSAAAGVGVVAGAAPPPVSAYHTKAKTALGAMFCHACGVDCPGRGPYACWKQGIKPGEALCVACFVKRSMKHACPVCGKMYAAAAAAEAAAAIASGSVDTSSKSSRERPQKEGGGSVPFATEEDEEWIQCDDCRRWVMTKCDPEIEDIELYDDSNPDHLHYACPVCKRRAAAGVRVQQPAQQQNHNQQSNASGLQSVQSILRPNDEDDTEAALAVVSERLETELLDGLRGSDGGLSDTGPGSLEELRQYKAGILKKCDGALKRHQREFERLLDRSRRDQRTQRTDIQEDFIRQFREHLDRLRSTLA